jgi:hypothetical protein
MDNIEMVQLSVAMAKNEVVLTQCSLTEERPEETIVIPKRTAIEIALSILHAYKADAVKQIFDNIKNRQ